MGKRKGMKLAKIRALAESGYEGLKREVQNLNKMVENLQELLRRETAAKEEVQQKLANTAVAPAKPEKTSKMTKKEK